MEASRTRPDLLRAIWAAKGRRSIDETTFREIVGQETAGRTESTKHLGIHEAHRVLDRLNGKDPQVEERRRVGWGNRGTRKGRARPRSPSGPSKISRPATTKQIDLIKHLAFHCGLTGIAAESDPAAYELDLTHLANWMQFKFGKAWKVVDRGGDTRFVCSDGLARKVIPALIKWINRRGDMWTAAHGREVARIVVGVGVPNARDKELPMKQLPVPVRARLEEATV